MRKIQVAINGFGRIGRAAFKIAFAKESEVEVVAINDLGDVDNLAYLLRYDTVYGRYAYPVSAKDGTLVVNEKPIKVLQEKDPTKLPWKEMNIDVVIESTGVFTDREGATQHLTAGAKRVVISAPTDSEDVNTIVVGVNEAGEDDGVVSNASCTTNCITPVAAVMEEMFGIEKAMLTTAHAYTATQSLVDGPARKDWRRGRAAAANLVPSSTGAAQAAAKALPSLKDKFDGVALRVPVPVVSISDLVFLLKQEVTVEQINEAFVTAAKNPRYQGVLTTTTDQVVSSDFIGDPHSAIVDLNLTQVVGGNLVKVMAWYDNEWGYSNRLVEQAIAFGGK